ncbi:DNA internalization-related competence protein ComEC/Rec2, partial [Streptococcus pyogenes]
IIFDVILLPLLSLLFLLSPFIAISQVNFLFDWLEKVIIWIADHSAFPLVFGKPNTIVLLVLFVFLALIYDFLHKKKLVLG